VETKHQHASKKNDLVGLLFGGSGAERSRSGAEPERATLQPSTCTDVCPTFFKGESTLLLFV